MTASARPDAPAGQPTAVARSARRRIVTVGLAVGMVSWALVGLWKAIDTRADNYPWNVWQPLIAGLDKGVVLGGIAGGAAVLGLRRPERSSQTEAMRRAVGFALLATCAPSVLLNVLGAVIGDVWPLHGARDLPALIGSWTVDVLLPAIATAVAVGLAAAHRPALDPRHRTRQDLPYWGLLLTAAIALPTLTYTITVISPVPQGNGDHVNDLAQASIAAYFLTILFAIYVLTQIIPRR